MAAPKIPFPEPDGIDLTKAEPWAVVRDGGHPDADHLHLARLATAALPIAARDAAYRLDREPGPRGFALRQNGRAVGHLPVAPPGARRRPQLSRRPAAVAAGARRGARGGRSVGAVAGRRAAGEEVGMSAAITAWESIHERRRRGPRRERPWRPKVYAPALRRDQLKALYYLKRFEGRPMTELLQEALDRYLEPHGGGEGVIERGVAKLGERGKVLCRRRGGR